MLSSVEATTTQLLLSSGLGEYGGKHRTKGTPTTLLAKSATEKHSQKRARGEQRHS